MQFGRKASEDKSGLQILPRLKTQLCNGKGTPQVGRVRGASAASSCRTPGSSCRGHRDRWSAQVTACTSRFIRRRIRDVSEPRQREPVLTARAGLSLGLCRRRTCACPTPAFPAQLLQSFVGTADRSKLNAPLLFCFFFPVYFFFRALRFFGKASDAIYS